MKTIRANYQAQIPKNFTGIVIWWTEAKFWYKDGLRHREDGPAVELASGSKFWYLKNQKYPQINLNNHVVLDYSKGEYGLMWYKLIDKDKIIDYPDIPGLIQK